MKIPNVSLLLINVNLIFEMSNVKFNPTEGENDKLVSVFSEINEGLDTTLNYTISDEGNKAKKNIVVNQVGKREKFLSKKGEESEPFVLSDGNTFNVLKEGASGSASAWADDQLPPEATKARCIYRPPVRPYRCCSRRCPALCFLSGLLVLRYLRHSALRPLPCRAVRL